MNSKSKWRKMAQKLWPFAEWITGNGHWALLAHCKVLTITLWPTYEEAEIRKIQIDKFACGGHCYGFHELFDLSIPRKPRIERIHCEVKFQKWKESLLAELPNKNLRNMPLTFKGE